MRVVYSRLLALLTVLLIVCGASRGHAAQPGDPGTTGLLTPPWTHVRAATTDNILLSNPGTDTFDGVLFDPGDLAINRRILVWQQTDATENGIYQWNTSATAMTRVADMNESRDFIPNMLILVRAGLIYRQNFFSLEHETQPTLGSTALTYGRSTTPCGGSLQPPCTDEDGALTSLDVLLAQLITLSNGPPSAGACLGPLHRIIDITNVGDEYVCPGGIGSNPIISYARSDAYTEFCADNGCANATGGETVNIVGSGGLLTERTAGTPDVLTIRPKTSRTLWIPAGAVSSIGSCGDPTEALLLVSGPKRYSVTCTDSDLDGVHWDFVFSASDRWNAGTLQVEAVGFSVSNQTGEVVVFDVTGQCVRDGDAVAAHSATGEQAVTLTFGATTSNEQISSLSSALTLQGTCAATSHVYMQALINASSTTFSPMADFRLLGWKVHWTAQ